LFFGGWILNISFYCLDIDLSIDASGLYFAVSAYQSELYDENEKDEEEDYDENRDGKNGEVKDRIGDKLLA